jgi:poly(A) polymerase
VTRKLDPQKQSWMSRPETRAVMAALTAEGGEARFVGGAVRNALLGEAVSDVDIATPLLPQEVVQRLTRAGLAAVPTGIAHGTITAVSSGKPFEITTLRRDVSTDGRRATVAFTTDWKEDAARRDFTMNALYASEDGTLLDPTGGIADLEMGRVRFVGDAAMRIREDYLRILRLFRFHAWYGKGALDSDALRAASAEKSGLARLSGERIQKELLRLLEAADPLPVLSKMDANGILGEILPGSMNLARLRGLNAVTATAEVPRAAILSLAALLAGKNEARETASRLRLSNADRDRLIAALDNFDLPLENKVVRRAAYRHTVETVIDRLLLRAAEAETKRASIIAAIRDLKAWTPPSFPLDGRDALRAGVPEGPGVGRVLSTIENWWTEQDFVPDRRTLLMKLKELLAQPDA